MKRLIRVVVMVLLPALAFGRGEPWVPKPPAPPAVATLTNEARYIEWKWRTDVTDPKTGVTQEQAKEKLLALGYVNEPEPPEPSAEREFPEKLVFTGATSKDGLYFITDYVPNLATTRLEMKFRLNDVTGQSSGLFAANGLTAGKAEAGNGTRVEYYYNKNGRTPWLNYTCGGAKVDVSGFNDTKDFHVLVAEGGSFLFDGVERPTAVEREPSGMADGPLVIAAMMLGSNSYYNFPKMELAYFKVSERRGDGTYRLVHDYRPGTNSSGEATLYDLVSQPCLTPTAAGTGKKALAAGGAGDAEFLRSRGIAVEVVPYAEYKNERVSSSRIRAALERGEIEDANAMLGRKFQVSGFRFQGKGLGTKIGFPTVNLRISERESCESGESSRIVLRRGVYEVEVGGLRGIANYGIAPTMGEKAWREPAMEIHFLHCPPPPLFSTSVNVGLLRFIRMEMKFDSVADLQRQIAADCATIRA